MIRLDSILTLYHVVYEKKESLLRMLQLSRNHVCSEKPLHYPYTEKAPLRKSIFFWGCQLRYKSSSLELIITCCQQKRTYQDARVTP